MPGSIKNKVTDFLPKFFGPGNEIQWEMIENGELTDAARACLEPWLSDLEKCTRPVLLPRIYAGDRTDWYALGFTAPQTRALIESITAFIGPSYSNFSGQAADLDPEDPVDRAVLELVGNHAIRFTVIGNENRAATNEALKTMRDLWEKQPERSRPIPRTTDRILRDFQMALVVRDYPAAEEYIEELRSGGHLSAQNLLFLRVRLLAAEENWETLLGLPELSALMDIRRPVLVTQSIIQAIYTTELAAFEAENNPAAAVSHFREHLLSKYMPLFKARGSMSRPEVMKSFMIMAVAANPPRHKVKKRILAEYSKDKDDYAYLESLTELVTAPPEAPEVPPLQQAQIAYTSNDFETAFQLLVAIPGTPESLRLLLLCGSEIDSLECARQAVQIMQECSPEEQKTVLGSKVFRRIWEDLLEICESVQDVPAPEAIPSDWTEWLDKLNQSGAGSADLRIVEQGATEWDADTFKHNPELVQRMADLLLKKRDRAAIEILHNALPYMIGFFMPEGNPEPTFKHIYQSLLMLLCLDKQIGSSDLIALLDLAAALLDIGISEQEYSELLSELEEAWSRIESPRFIYWILDALDLLTAFPVQCKDSLMTLFSKAISSFSRWKRRVTREQWELLTCLSEDLDLGVACSGLPPDPEETAGTEAELKPSLKNKTVAVYTLTESVGKRVKDVLGRLLDGARIEVSNDHVGCDRLRTMAQTADIFLVATRSAKHAATDFIKAHRPKHLPTLYPRGKGSASILLALSEHLRQETPA